MIPFAAIVVAVTSGTSDITLIVSILGALGIGAIAAAIVTGLFSRRKLGAEAASLITSAAHTVTTMMEKRLAESVAEVARQREIMEHMTQANHNELAKMAKAHADERSEMRRVLQLHVAWDAIAIAKMAEFGVELPPTPPVTPANRFTDADGYPLSLG